MTNYYTEAGILQDKKQYTEAMALYQKGAAENDAKCHCAIAHLLLRGCGCERDDATATKLLEAHFEEIQALAEAGDPEATLLLATYYHHGFSPVAQDLPRALSYTLIAAHSGLAEAQVRAGEHYKRGIGTERDDAKAVEWYQRAAAQGNSTAQWRLGLSYEMGEGVKQDYTEAAIQYRYAAEQEDGEAQWRLGFLYFFGFGVKQDIDLAVTWFRRSAAQGNSVGQWRLGFMYENGLGVKKDLSLAAAWYRKSALRGDPVGQRMLESLAARAK